MVMRTLVIFFLLSISARAAIIPADRMAPWQGNVGVTGGMPDSSTMTVFTTVSAGASAATINTAIQNCPAGQVVQLAAGTYTPTARIVGKSDVVLRGAGMNSTIINPSHNNYGGAIFVGGSHMSSAIYGNPPNFNGGTVVNWTAGYTQGTTNITLSSTSGLTVGNIIVLDQLSDPAWVDAQGYEGNNNAGRPVNGAGQRATMQFSRVTAIAGNVVSISPGIALPFWSGSRSPQAWWMGAHVWTSRFGIENMTINGAGVSGFDPYRANIYFETARDCWVKNVRSTKPTIAHVAYWGAINCEVRHSYFFDTKSAASLSYGIVPVFAAWLLVEDNIFEKVTAPVIPAHSSHCSVASYNYMVNMYYSQANNFLMAGFQPHDAHNYMWLAEGNWIESKIDADFIHGSSSHNVIYRNRIVGWEPNQYPGGPTTQNMNCIHLDIKSRGYSAIGNILGRTGTYTSNYEASPVAGWLPQPVIYDLGFKNFNFPAFPDDPTTVTTFYRHCNWDAVTGFQDRSRELRHDSAQQSLSLGKTELFQFARMASIQLDKPRCRRPAGHPGRIQILQCRGRSSGWGTDSDTYTYPHSVSYADATSRANTRRSHHHATRNCGSGERGLYRPDP